MNKRNQPPRTTFMAFKTSAPDAQRLKEAAAKQGKPVSTLIHETLKKHVK
jgi:predicted DNA binding CopG/RHH family protein